MSEDEDKKINIFSHQFAKELMAEEGLPTPKFMPVDENTLAEGLAFLESLKPPFLLRRDSADAEHEALIIDSLPEAKDALEEMVRVAPDADPATGIAIIEDYIPVEKYHYTLDISGPEAAVYPTAADPGFMTRLRRMVIEPLVQILRALDTPLPDSITLGILDVEGQPVITDITP
ncbi:MAG: hypothetical protein HDR80_09365 [Bacteroides sp.]|nr:hypothetical protein [Bacteroides sp.]